MKKQRVLVAMSGGVDSSVAALLMQRQGHEVVGVTLNLWSYENRLEPYNGCCSLEVCTVAKQLGIEHHVLDAGRPFETEVVTPFVAAYLAGLTPSPCGACNRRVRFPALLEAARRFGCTLLVTGHHARLVRQDGEPALLRGVDPFKDQSYFLYGLRPEQLERIALPIGEMHKREVWALAREAGLVAARKPESQDLCFLPGGDYRAYLRAHAPEAVRPGEIVDLEGNVVGQHEGLAFYTIGQRRGLQVSLGQRVYVVDLDPERNRVVVGPEAALLREGLLAVGVNWLMPRPRGPLEARVQVRSRGPARPAQLYPDDEGVLVRFREPQRAITPGQLAVFYRGERVLGGGVIRRSLDAKALAVVLERQLAGAGVDGA